MNPPSFLSLNAWAAHERLCLRLLEAALRKFPVVDPDEGEDALNRRLYFHITETGRDIERAEGVTLPVVVPEGLNPPLATDEERAAREHKRPDFYWAYHDHDGREFARQFVVECKRLTLPSRSWVYSEQYVVAGVRRFASTEHGYGAQAWAGAMVAYLQNLQADEALAQVNQYLGVTGLPELPPGTDSAGTRRLAHKFSRPFDHSPFSLFHIWRLPDA